MTVRVVCRTCLGSHDLRPLFPRDRSYPTVREELHLCTGLKMEMDDGLPQSICGECSSAIQSALHYRDRSQAIEKQLHRELTQIKTETPYKRICFDDNQHLKRLTNANEARLKNEQKCGIKVKKEMNEFQDDENSALIIHFPNNVFEVTTVSKINDLLDTLLSELNDRQSNEDVLKINDIKTVKHEFNKDLNFQDLVNFDDVDDYNVNFDEDGSKLENNQTELEPQEVKETKPKLTRLDLIDGKPNKCGPNQCRLCKKICPNLKAFYKHLNIKHFGNKKVILCEFCAMRFADNQKLLRHCRARHGLERDNSFPCSYCPYRALDKEQLDVHERRVHTKERPFVCDNCGAGFFSKRVLIQHSRNHTDDKPYQCDKCPSKFKTRQRLCGHNIKIHLRRFAYACPLCDKRLSKSPYIRRHLFKEHGVPLHEQGKLLKIYLYT